MQNSESSEDSINIPIFIEWNKETFKDYHNDKDIFSKNVLKFFFFELVELINIEDYNLKYCFIKDETYNFLKYDDDNCINEKSLANFYRFVNYYKSLIKLIQLLRSIELKSAANNDFIIIPLSNTKKSNIIKCVSTIELQQLNNKNLTEIVSKLNLPTFILTTDQINKIINIIKKVLRYDQKNDTYYTEIDGIETIINESYFVLTTYNKLENNQVIKHRLNNLIRENKHKFVINNDANSFIKHEDLIEHGKNIINSFSGPIKNIIPIIDNYNNILIKPLTDSLSVGNEATLQKIKDISYIKPNLNKDINQKEIVDIDNILDECRHNCLLLKKGSFQGVSYDKIIDISVLRKYIDSDLNYKIKISELIGDYTSAHKFTINLKTYVKEHSKKYEVKYDSENTEIKGRSGRCLFFIK